jgi:hypothetical protein
VVILKYSVIGPVNNAETEPVTAKTIKIIIV